MTKSNPREYGKFENDLHLYQKFLASWEAGLISLGDPVYGLVRNQAYLLCRKFDRTDEVEDFIQTGLIFLARGQYKGNCPLGAYIRTILRNEIMNLWKQTGAVNREKIDEETPDPQTNTAFEKVFRHLSSENFMRRLMLSRSQLQLEIIKAIVEYDGEKRLSRNQIVRTLQQKNYERYEIIVSYEKLKSLLMPESLAAQPTGTPLPEESSLVVEPTEEKSNRVEELVCCDGRGVWPDLLEHDVSDEGIEKYFEHVENCNYHLKLVEKDVGSFTNFLSGMDQAFGDIECEFDREFQNEQTEDLRGKYIYNNSHPRELRKNFYALAYHLSPIHKDLRFIEH